MSEADSRIAVLEERSRSQDARIAKLEANQRWVVLAIAGTLISTFVTNFMIGV